MQIQLIGRAVQGWERVWGGTLMRQRVLYPPLHAVPLLPQGRRLGVMHHNPHQVHVHPHETHNRQHPISKDKPIFTKYNQSLCQYLFALISPQRYSKIYEKREATQKEDRRERMSHRKGIQKLEADRGKGELRLQKKEEVTMKQKEEKKTNDLCKHR